MLQVLQHGGVQIQRVVLLREIADLAAVPVLHHAGVRLLDVREQAQRGGFAGAVVAQDHHARALVDGQVDAGEHDVRPVRLGDVLGLDRRAAAGCGFREADVRHLLLLLRLAGLGEQAFGAAHHVLRGHGLGGLGMQADALFHQAFGLLLGHLALTASTFLVHHALVQIRLPAHRIHVDLPALRVQMPDLVHHLVQQFGGVGDDQESALIPLQVAAQPFDRVGVQVVGRLVQDHRVRIGEQDARQLHAAALAAGERAERLVHDLLRQSQRFGHRVGLGLGRVSAGLVEVLHRLVVAVQGLGHHVRVRVGHLPLGLAHAADNGGDVEAMKEYFTRLVGLEKNEEEGSLTFTFNTPVNQFTAMSNLSSTLTSPIPLQFIKDLAAECGDTNPNTMYRTAMKDAYGTANSHNETYTPVDNTLSLSAYMLEDCQEGFNVYKRNPEWVEFKSTDPTINTRYSIEGIKILYLSGAQSDPNFAFNQFINVGNLDAISIPKDYMNQYVNDRRTTTTQGDSTFKLNLNTATQKEWDELFKATSGANPYTCKPLMSNDNFVNALSFAIDRQTYAQTRGSVASQSYFAPAYLWEPEKGLSYNDTPQHAAAIAEYSPETNGYDFDLAVQLMDQAIAEEINKGNYSGYNDSEKITINWMNTTDPQEYGIELTQYFAKAFAATNAAKRGFKLTFENIPGTTNYQDVYDIMEKGTFDMAFGSVSGMQLDPLGFMEVLKSDNSSGFTLNWGIDTSSMKEDYIIYDGMRWSFDGLWTAATKGAVIEDDGGVNKEPVKLSRPSSSITSGKVTVGDNTQVDAWSIIYQFQAEVNASGLSFKAFADAQKKEDEYVTVTLSYKVKGDQATHTAVFNANYGELFFFRDGDLDANGAFNYGATANKGARFQIYVPKVLDQNSTFNQIAGNPIDLTQCTELTMSIYATYYMEIDNIPVSTTLTSANVKVI